MKAVLDHTTCLLHILDDEKSIDKFMEEHNLNPSDCGWWDVDEIEDHCTKLHKEIKEQERVIGCLD